MSGWLQNVIGGPVQAHGVHSAEEYRARALAAVRAHGVPGLTEQSEQSVAYVSDGRWVVDCACGNSPSASHEWGLAICMECGAVYEPTFPAARPAIEDTLLARARPSQRHFFPQRGETLQSLKAENRQHGDAATRAGKGRR
jgi:hypothetical protein